MSLLTTAKAGFWGFSVVVVLLFFPVFKSIVSFFIFTFLGERG